jgi:hypothetical protein
MNGMRMMAMGLSLGLCLAACGDDSDGDDGGSDASTGANDGVGTMTVTISGGVFAEPVTYVVSNDDLSAYVFPTSMAMVWTTTEPITGSDGVTSISGLTMGTEGASTPGTYDGGTWDFQFNLNDVNVGDRTIGISIADEDEPGQLTITTEADGIITGNFTTQGRATQLNQTEPVYTLEGTFSMPF